MTNSPQGPRDSMAQALDYPCAEPPGPGQALALGPDLLWLRLPLGGSLEHINCWALRDGPGWALVDTGLHTPATEAAWTSLLGPDGPFDGRGLSRVLVTHMHPDHVGMAGWLSRGQGVALWMTQTEYMQCRVLAADTGREAPPEALGFYRQAGWDEAALAHYRRRFGGFGRMVTPMPQSYRRIRDGETLSIGEQTWRVIVGSGHTPEHACLYCPERKLLISGDQVLPTISSNVSVFPTEPGADPLGDWLASMDKLRALVPDDVLVLPAHGEPFRGLHARLERLAGGHLRSLERLRRALAKQPRRAVDTFPTLFVRKIGGDADPHLLQLATGESLAHLNHLVHRGEVTLEIDAEGIGWYRA